ncbi:MAG: hypothetical protein KZQ58_01295 [gamma proteobacterium symbiont of Bathyaustriella thionipta]|nr:hypothetical protein [gamma proteobacterium symbiont of Bathyaustriella thionipta]
MSSKLTKSHPKQALSAESKTQPWLSKAEWKNNRIASTAKHNLWLLWSLTLVLSLLCVFLAFRFNQVWNEHGMVALLLAAFPLAAFVMLNQSIKASREWLSYGTSTLTLDPFPASIGGDAAGYIHLELPYVSGQIFEIRLECVHHYAENIEENKQRKSSSVWQQQGYARVTQAASGVAVAFRFQIPAYLPASKDGNINDSRYSWHLYLKSRMSSDHLDREFIIPAFPGSQTSSSINFLSVEEQPESLHERTLESILPLRQQTASSVLVHYPILRNLPDSLGTAAIGTIPLLIGIFLFNKNPDGGFSIVLMSWGAILLGAGFSLSALYSALNSLKVEINPEGVRSTRFILGIPLRSRFVARQHIGRIKTNPGSCSNAQKLTGQFDVYVDYQHKLILLAEGVTGEADRYQVVKWFEQRLK